MTTENTFSKTLDIPMVDRVTKVSIWLEIVAEHPWRVRAYGKPLWLALILHPFKIRYKGGTIYIKELTK